MLKKRKRETSQGKGRQWENGSEDRDAMTWRFRNENQKKKKGELQKKIRGATARG